MKPYDGPDEYPIASVPAEHLWSENFAALYACRKTGVALSYSTGRWHGDPHLWRESMIITLPNGDVAFSRGYGRPIDKRTAGGNLSRYEIVDPGRSTRLTFDGPMMQASVEHLLRRGSGVGSARRCKIDVTFDSAAPVWNMSSASAEAQKVAGAMHIDHLGTVNGTIEYDGQVYRLEDAYGIRDHSRGVRDMTHYAGHNWLNGIFPSGRGFYLYAMKGPNGAMGMSNAAVVLNDRLYPARIIETEFARTIADFAKPHRLKLESELGEMAIEFAKTISTIPLGLANPFDVCAGLTMASNVAMEFDEPMIISSEGEEGVGWSERGFADGWN